MVIEELLKKMTQWQYRTSLLFFTKLMTFQIYSLLKHIQNFSFSYF